MVAVLFARSDSVYKQLPHLDVYDAERDARTWPGGVPVVAHPPCRAWGRLRHFACPRHDEKALGLFAVDAVRAYGGVLEHPEASSLWTAAGLPRPGERDAFGGFTFPCSQKWWGHPAEKKTWLYIVGITPSQLPAFPISFAPPLHRIGKNGEGPKALREHTPPDLAVWLVELARRCHTGFEFLRSGESATGRTPANLQGVSP